MMDGVVTMSTRLSGCAIAAALILSLFGCLATGAEGTLTVHFVDVGQGDSTLVVGPSGEAILIDGGKNRTALEYLERQGVSHLALVVASSLDEDHIGGLIPILETLSVDEVAVAGGPSSSDVVTALDNAVTASRARRLVVSRGQELVVGSLVFEVLNPVAASPDTSGNGWIVLRLTCAETSTISVGQDRGSFLFASDIDASTESDIILSGLPLRAGVLKVASHGSCSASSPAFLQAVHPDLAIVSVGQNGQGDPCPAVLSRLEAAGATIWRTDRDATVVIQSPCATVAHVVNQAPTAAFAFDPASPAPGQPITADASASVDPDGTIVSYSWTFSDGTTVMGSKVTHAYPDPGTYWICLTVADDAGAASTQCQRVTIPTQPDVRIECVLYYGTIRLGEPDEFVQIRNYGTAPQNLSRWTLKNLSRSLQPFTFPGYVLEPGAVVRVYTNEVHWEWGGFSVGYGAEIWSDTTPNTAALYDASGNEASRCVYPLQGFGVCSSCSVP